MERFEIFEELVQFFKFIGFEFVLFFAGLFGAFVNVSKKKKLTLIERITSIFSGGLVANYLTPSVIDIINLKENSSYAAAFILGYLGLKSVEFVIEYFQEKFSNKNKEV